ncbi:unnamed protein product, partial [Prunus brigantina]
NCLAVGQRGHFVVGVPSSQKTWRRHRVLVSGARESAPGVIVERHIPTLFQMISRTLGSPSDRFHKTLLDYKNLFRVGLIIEPEYLRRKKEEEEKEKEMAGGREMNEATKRGLEARAAQKKQKRPSQPPRVGRHRQARRPSGGGRRGWPRPNSFGRPPSR